MPGVNYGRAVMKMRPDWNPGQTARPLDVVYYQNCLWACLRETNALPSLASADWMLSVRSVESDTAGAAEGQVLTIVKAGQDLKAQYKALPTYGINDISGLAAALAGKSPTNHTHAAGDINWAALASRKINTAAPLSGGGDLSADRTLKLDLGKGLKVDNGLLALAIASGSAIILNGKGEVDIDFGQMPTDKFDAMLKSLRLPKWLTSAKTWHVNGATGSDNNDGETAATAFKTIQKALNNISENYNIGNYNCTVQVAAGSYAKLVLPKLNTGTGIVTIQGAGKDQTSIDVATSGSAYGIEGATNAGTWVIRQLSVNLTLSGAASVRGLYARAGAAMHLYDVAVNCARPAGSTAAVYMGWADQGGAISFYDNVELKNTRGDNSAGVAVALYGREFNLFLASGLTENSVVLAINGQYTRVVDITDGGRFLRNPIGTPTVGGTATGQRYYVRAGAICNTQGGGPEFFPGDTAGTADTAHFGVYM